MDLTELLTMPGNTDGVRAVVTGWLVDRSDGLYVLADHYPEEYEYPCRVRVNNDGIIYPILAAIPVLVGGWSKLFYRVRMGVAVVGSPPQSLFVETISIEVDRESGKYEEVDISPSIVERFVEIHGKYKFEKSNAMRDWIIGEQSGGSP